MSRPATVNEVLAREHWSFRAGQLLGIGIEILTTLRGHFMNGTVTTHLYRRPSPGNAATKTLCNLKLPLKSYYGNYESWADKGGTCPRCVAALRREFGEDELIHS